MQDVGQEAKSSYGRVRVRVRIVLAYEEETI